MTMNLSKRTVSRTLKAFAHLPRLPDGRIDYSRSDRAPVVTCFVKFQGKILLLKRSDRVRTYRGKWSAVAGYLDEPVSIRAKALKELEEELEIPPSEVVRVRTAPPYEFFDPEAKKSWLVHPVLVEVRRKPEIKLDWEHTEWRWILPHEMARYDTVPKLEESLRRVI
ncbi:MAG TPA: NUDIX domain-containing protein [Candidatus Binatia bacterium]